MNEPIIIGVAVIEERVLHLPELPGVYRMLDKEGKPLYVGKAKNLVKRVRYYTQIDRLTPRLKTMVAMTSAMEIVVTKTEMEALLLEAHLIKRLKPRYNILLKDDKTFPYILLTKDHPYSQLSKHRGKQTSKGTYFGPFLSAKGVDEAIIQLQKVFGLRSCADTVFASRTRPCLLYQIKRCSGPCVNKISEAAYRESVEQAEAFLSGKSNEVQKRLSEQMEEASNRCAFEQAAIYRDRLKALVAIQARQMVYIKEISDADIIALYQQGDTAVIQLFFYRAGQPSGSTTYTPLHTEGATAAEIMRSFLVQFYQNHPCPKQVLLSHAPEELDEIEAYLGRECGHAVQVSIPKRGPKHEIVMRAIDNAKEKLEQQWAARESQLRLLNGAATWFRVPHKVVRIEVYDNSHISGQHAVGAMIVAGEEGFMKNAYRRFNMEASHNAGGDDYAMMKKMLTRRFKRLMQQHPEPAAGTWPDIAIIDGGLGQLSAALSVRDALQLPYVTFVAMAKGPDRDAGKEQFFLEDGTVLRPDSHEPTMHYLQRLRDEAHRFAITFHRAKRSRSLKLSSLDEIPGIGAKRKKALLHHFGSPKAVFDASVEELMQVEGVHKAVAEQIFAFVRGKEVGSEGAV